MQLTDLKNGERNQCASVRTVKNTRESSVRTTTMSKLNFLPCLL
jgi:hypothetical protein